MIFKTIPLNDRGSPLILEKMLMNGNNKYPVRDPFKYSN
jgi:Zn-dependent M16 (insulinase) family peptidase